MKNKFYFFIVAVIGLIGAGCNDAKVRKQTTSSNVAVVTASNSEKVKPTEQTLSMMADDLIIGYEKNETDADVRYKGKTLVVQGKILNIAETSGQPTIQLSGTNPRSNLTVMCSFDETQKAAVGNLKKGQMVTLQGTGNGKAGKLYAAMTGCKVL